MKLWLSFLLFATVASAQTCYVRQGSHYFPISRGPTAAITPQYWTALLTQSGRYTSGVIALSLSMEGTREFVYGGQGSWNPGTTPANVRLFFSTQPRYNLKRAGRHEDDYWWSVTPGSMFIFAASDEAGKMNIVLSAALKPEHWSNAQGHRAADRPEGFSRATKRVRQWGVSFGGGSFYDVGCATVWGTGTAKVTIANP